jgi:hypothetical protein
MSSIKLTADSGGGTFELKAPASSSNTRVLTLPDAASGTVLTSKFGPSFAARNNAAQTITNNSSSVIAFDTEYFDTDSCYNTSNYRFTPNVAGIYLINCSIQMASMTGVISLDIRLNGTRYCNSALNQDGSGLQTVDSSVLVSLNGSSDYIDVTIFNNSGANKNTVASPSNNLVNHFSGCYMRGQA